LFCAGFTCFEKIRIAEIEILELLAIFQDERAKKIALPSLTQAKKGVKGFIIRSIFIVIILI